MKTTKDRLFSEGWAIWHAVDALGLPNQYSTLDELAALGALTRDIVETFSSEDIKWTEYARRIGDTRETFRAYAASLVAGAARGRAPR